MQDLAGRLRHRVQLTTDGNSTYIAAVEDTFGADIDYAILQKILRARSRKRTCYSPAKVVSTFPEIITGEPDPRHVSTSYIERQNLTMRMHMRRFTRLTNRFSKKLENQVAAVALHYMHYNFAAHPPHTARDASDAGGLSDHLWSIEEIIGLLDRAEREPAA